MTKPIKFHLFNIGDVSFAALQLSKDISMIADAGDYLIVTDTGAQLFMSEPGFNEFLKANQTEP